MFVFPAFLPAIHYFYCLHLLILSIVLEFGFMLTTTIVLVSAHPNWTINIAFSQFIATLKVHYVRSANRSISFIILCYVTLIIISNYNLLHFIDLTLR